MCVARGRATSAPTSFLPRVRGRIKEGVLAFRSAAPVTDQINTVFVVAIIFLVQP